MAAPRVLSRRLSPTEYRWLASATVVAVVVLVVTGAAVRLTGSGLGCPKWPTCSAGHVVAPDSLHPGIEFANRVFTGLGAVAMAVAALGAFVRAPRRRDLCWLGLGLAGGLLAEIVLGGVMVKHRLEPGYVMAHFLLSMVIVLDAVVLAHRAALPDGAPRRPAGDRDLVRISRVVVGLVAATVVAGTVVTGAGPHSGANAADGRVARWQLNLHHATQIHGALAMLVVAAVGATWWLLRSHRAPAEARRRLQYLTEALAGQVVVGYTQYFSGVPVLLVGIHVLGAATVWVCALRFTLFLSSGAALTSDPRLPDAAPADREPAPA